MTARDCSMYSILTCTVFDLHSIQCFITHRYWYWHWDRPILLGIGCLFWYRSNPINFTTSTHHFYGFKFRLFSNVLCKNAECKLMGNDVTVFVIKCLMLCKQMIDFLHRLLFYKVFKVIDHTNGKVVL